MTWEVTPSCCQVLSRDSVTVSVDPVVYYRVSNPTMVRPATTSTSVHYLQLSFSRPQIISKITLIPRDCWLPQLWEMSWEQGTVLYCTVLYCTVQGTDLGQQGGGWLLTVKLLGKLNRYAEVNIRGRDMFSCNLECTVGCRLLIEGDHV